MKALFNSYISHKFMAIFWASTLAMLIEYLLNLSDSIIIGHFWNDEGLTAVSAVLPFYSFVIFVAYMIACGTGVRFAYHKGKGNNRLAEEYFSQAIILSVIGGLALSLVSYAAGEAFLGLLALEPAQLELAKGYYNGYVLLPLPQFLYAALYTLVLYMGGERQCNISAVIMFVLNIGISVMLAANVGIVGVSLGTAMANLIALAPLVAFLGTEKGRIHFRWTLAHVGTMARISFAEASVFLFVSAEAMLLDYFLQSSFSGNVLVVFTVIANIQVFFLTLFEGLCEYVTVMASIYYGEGNLPAIRHLMKFMVKAAVCECLVLLAIMLPTAIYLPQAFGIMEADTYSQAVQAVELYLPCMLAFCFLKLMAAYYICIDRIKLSVVISFSHLLVLPVAGAVLGGFLYKLPGAWMGLNLSQWAGCGLLFAYWYILEKGNWLLLPQPSPAGLFMNLPSQADRVDAAITAVDERLQDWNIPSETRQELSDLMAACPLLQPERDCLLELTLLPLKPKQKIKLIIRDTAKLIPDADKKAAAGHSRNFQQSYSIPAGNNRVVIESR